MIPIYGWMVHIVEIFLKSFVTHKIDVWKLFLCKIMKLKLYLIPEDVIHMYSVSWSYLALPGMRDDLRETDKNKE